MSQPNNQQEDRIYDSILELESEEFLKRVQEKIRKLEHEYWVREIESRINNQELDL